MKSINYERTGEYLKTCLQILKKKGGECPSNELIKEMEKHLSFDDYEKSFNNSGQLRWLTHFRFYSINLVKAGWIIKKGGKWILTDKAKGFEIMTPADIYNFGSNAYESWNSSRGNNNEILDEDEKEEVYVFTITNKNEKESSN